MDWITTGRGGPEFKENIFIHTAIWVAIAHHPRCQYIYFAYVEHRVHLMTIITLHGSSDSVHARFISFSHFFTHTHRIINRRISMSR